MSRGKSKVRARTVGVAVLAVIVGGFCTYVLQDNATAKSTYVSHSSDAITPLTREVWTQAAYLGDSYTGGSYMNSSVNTVYANLIAPKLKLYANLFTVGGSGFLNGKDTGENFAPRVPRIIDLKPDLIVVQGGHNDVSKYPADQVGAEALRDLQQLRRGVPNAPIVVIGPVWPTGDQFPDLLAVRDALHADQQQIPNSYWIDPVAEGWFAGPYAKLIGSDKTHPTDAGHIHLAEVFTADLNRLGVLARLPKPHSEGAV